MASNIPVECRRAFRIAGALGGLTIVLGGCTHADEVVATASIPEDYRLRHPIAIQEADRSVVIFVGHSRGGLSAEERADVMGLAQTWLQEGAGEPERCFRRRACRPTASPSTTTIRITRVSCQRCG